MRLICGRYERHITINGVLWLHRITDPRFTGSGLRNLNVLKSLVGEENFRNVRLITTFWSAVDAATGLSRTRELESRNEFWKTMIEQGSQICKYENNTTSAHAIITSVLGNQRSVLELQKELVDQSRALWQTAAGRVVESGLLDFQKKIEDQLREIQAELAESTRAKDFTMAEFLNEEQRKLFGRLQEATASIDSFKAYPSELSGLREQIEAVAEQQQYDSDQAIWILYEQRASVKSTEKNGSTDAVGDARMS